MGAFNGAETSSVMDSDEIVEGSIAFYHCKLDVDSDRVRQIVHQDLGDPAVMAELQTTLARLMANTTLLAAVIASDTVVNEKHTGQVLPFVDRRIGPADRRQQV